MTRWSFNPGVYFDINEIFLRGDGAGISVSVRAIGIVGIVKI